MPENPAKAEPDPAQRLTQVLENRYAELRLFALRKCGSAVMADDVMQDVWLRLVKLNTTIDTESIKNPVSYIHRIISNLIIDRQRQTTIRGRYFANHDVPDTVISEVPSPFQTLAGQQEFAILRQAILELPPVVQKVLILYRMEGLTMKEIAGELNITVRLVATYLATAMKHCRQRLHENDKK
ncbi:MAG: RNA polymerase sigma factor [Asticcacaulis sp.]